MPQNPGWYYDEFKQIGVDYTDLKEEETYDLSMQKLRDIENEAKGILELLKIKNTDLVLEIGTGTGELALKLSGHCKKVVAIDVSRTMIYFATPSSRLLENDGSEKNLRNVGRWGETLFA